MVVERNLWTVQWVYDKPEQKQKYSLTGILPWFMKAWHKSLLGNTDL